MTQTDLELGHVVQFVTPQDARSRESDGIPTLAQTRRNAEQRAILDALGRVGGNRERAAKLLRISPATLYRKLGARRPQPLSA